jgi:hypothetical protein
MNNTDLDKIVDKLLIFRKKINNMCLAELNWWQTQVVEDMAKEIDQFIYKIDRLGEALE